VRDRHFRATVGVRSWVSGNVLRHNYDDVAEEAGLAHRSWKTCRPSIAPLRAEDRRERNDPQSNADAARLRSKIAAEPIVQFFCHLRRLPGRCMAAAYAPEIRPIRPTPVKGRPRATRRRGD